MAELPRSRVYQSRERDSGLPRSNEGVDRMSWLTKSGVLSGRGVEGGRTYGHKARYGYTMSATDAGGGSLKRAIGHSKPAKPPIQLMAQPGERITCK